MMRRVKACDMGLRATGGRPLSENRALRSIDDLDDAFTIYDISHSRVQPIRRRVKYDTRRFLALHLNTPDKLSRLGVDYFDGSFFTSFRPSPHGNVIQPLGGIKGSVIWVPTWGVLATRQLNGSGHLKRISVQGHNGVVPEIHPEL